VKLHKISEIYPTFPLPKFDFMTKYHEGFVNSELSRIRAILPLSEIASSIAVRSKNRSRKGKKSMFPPEGEIALMFLKSYTGLSDDGLIEMLNGSVYMQLFCGVLIEPCNPIKDGKIVSAIRNRLAEKIDIKELQKILYDKWQDKISNKDLCLTDTTCYESFLRFPTDVKLLWECCEWLHALMAKTCKKLTKRLTRNKYNDINKARLEYAKQRKHSAAATSKIRRRLHQLLYKLITQWDNICPESNPTITLSAEQNKRLSTLREVYNQQKDLIQKKAVEHRIVSIDRPYIRPIIRCKENKRVKFGAKVNNIQIDGISFIEHLSFEAFNEGIRMKQCIEYQESITGVQVKRFGGDSIYANNANRSFCTEKGITTSFVRKDPKPKEGGKETRTARRIIGTLRSTMMEGSFGTQKQHYGVGRIAARNQNSETLQLFFGIHMANAALAARELAMKQSKKKEPA
jgi:hypothetical protein